MPPDIVIRPSGIWNTRARMHNYLHAHRRHQRTYYMHLCATYLLQKQLDAIPVDYQSSILAREALGIGKERERIRKVWARLERGWGLNVEDGTPHRPSVEEARRATVSSIIDVRQSSIVALVSSFETFVLAWALNYLLARLEAGAEWTNEERDVAMALSPEHQWRPAPGWPWVTSRVPLLEEGLMELPHVLTDPASGWPAEEPITPELNAYRVMRFWRDFRNRVVHAGGIVSKEFYSDNYTLF
jgi:hypothetical protein